MLYFAYGSNLLSRRLVERIGPCTVVDTAAAHGYRLVFHKRGADGSAKADAWYTGRDGDVVWGVVYGLTAEQKLRLDRFEGAGYRTADVPLERVAPPRQALGYVAVDEYIDPSLVPFKWYRDLVIAGAYQWGLPAAYIEFLETHPAQRDPDRRRERRHMAVLQTRI